MKLTIILLTSVFLQVQAIGVSQTITLSAKETDIKKVFVAIEQQTGYMVLYNKSVLRSLSAVTFSVNNMQLKDFLLLILKDAPVSFRMEDKTIILSREVVPAVDLSSIAMVLSPIRGRVLDADGQPLAGVTVMLKGGKVLGVTNAEGVFSVNVSVGDVLVISSVGFESTDYKISSAVVASSDQQSTPGTGIHLTITLKRKETSLNEVVINKGYYTEKQKLSVSNVGRVTAKEIERQPVNNPLLALAGRVPGLVITQNSGVPGGGISVRIRGENSIQNGNEPLYIIDDVPYTSSLLPNLGGNILGLSSGSIGSNPLNFINPSDIESISILKDADATAIYGSRGANGVILISTKKGTAKRTSVGFNFSSGIGRVAHKLNLMNTAQYLEMRREAFKNDGEIPDQYNAPDLTVWDSTHNMDWQKRLIGGSAHYTRAQASISGGNVYTQYVISGNYNKETTVFPGGFSDRRGAMHVNINNSSSNEKFKSSLSLNYLADNNQLPSVDIGQVIILPPNAPEPLNPDGSLNLANSTWPSGNPFMYTKMKYKSLTNNLVANLSVSYELLAGLIIKSSFGYTNMQVDEISTVPIAAQDPTYYSPTGSASFTGNSIRSWIAEPQMIYQKKLGGGKLEALIGTTFQQNKSAGQILDGYGYTSDLLLESSQAAPQISISSVTNILYKYNAAFARLNYNWANKYVLNLNWRRDGSSRFGDNNKFHSFGSGGVAWIFSSEDFIQQSLPFLSYGKLRGSYGTTGSDQIGDYRFYDLYSTNTRPYQGMVGLSPTSIYNPDLQWEETKKWEGGIDLGLFKDKILLSASYYNNRSSNQLLSYIISAVTGFTSYPTNFPATVENKGLEFSLNTINIKSKNFAWESSLNLTIPRNELVAFPNLQKSSYNTRLIIGKPITIGKVFDLVGVNDTTGVYQFRNSKGGLTYDPDYGTDMTELVNAAPEYYGGFSNSFSYKNFQLDFIFQFTKKTGSNYLFQPFQPAGGFGTNRTTDNLDRWQKPGDIAPIQQFTQSFSSNTANAYRSYAAYSDYAFSDASFIRLKNAEIAYKLPEKLLKKAHIQNCRIYAQGQNLWTITKYNGLDPESFGATPPLRMIVFGIEASF